MGLCQRCNNIKETKRQGVMIGGKQENKRNKATMGDAKEATEENKERKL